MNGYTKLFGSILASTIWGETKETKVLWITMLAMADKNGEVQAATPGLATMARLTIEETELALTRLMAPDPYSRTKDFEGRRIEEIDGGWVILNHAKYRAKMNVDDRREYLTQAKRKEREAKRQQLSTEVNKRRSESTPSTHAEAEASPEAEAKAGNTNTCPPRKPREDDAMFVRFWEIFPSRRKTKKQDARKAWASATKRATPETIVAAAEEYAASPAGMGEYAPMPSTWLNGSCWEDDRAAWQNAGSTPGAKPTHRELTLIPE